MGQPYVSRRTFVASAGASISVVPTSGCIGADEKRIVAGILPDVDPDTAIDQNRPLADYLAEAADVSIDLETTSDYASLVQAMAAEEIDLAYFGGISYVMAHNRAGAKAIVVAEQHGITEWQSVFIANENTAITEPEDIADEDVPFVLGDPLSTTGSVMPTYYAYEELGIDLESEVDGPTHVGAHDAVFRIVANHDADAGALNSRIYDTLREDREDASVREVWRTPSFPNYPWAVAPWIDEEIVDDLRSAFLTFHESVPAEDLAALNVDRYVETEHDAFLDLMAAAEFLDILED